MNTLKRYAMALSMTGLLASSAAWAIELADVPLFLTVPLAPNIIVTLDTSGSMDAAHTPDSLSGIDGTKRYKSPDLNPMYYNPSALYTPPYKSDGTVAATSFSKAWINGLDTTKGFGDLNTQYKPTKSYSLSSAGNTYDAGQTFAGGTNPFAVAGAPTAYSYNCTIDFNNRNNGDRIEITSAGCNGIFSNITVGTVLTVAGAGYPGTYTVTVVESGNNRVEVGNGWNNDSNNKNVTLSWSIPGVGTLPAYYYRYYNDIGAAKPAACDGTKTNDDCYLPFQVTVASGSGTQDLNGDGAINAADKDERQNFANWYSFYRVRTLAMATSADLAFWSLPSTNAPRVAWQNLTTCNTFAGNACQGRSNTTYPNYIKDFTGTHRENFFKWLFDMKVGGTTPLRSAAKRAGEYVANGLGGTNDPFAEFPQVDSGTVFSCRKNFHILMTDGQWNTMDETETINVGNLDGTLAAPYFDTASNSLADVIYYYWATDLRSTLDNNVPQSIKVDGDETYGAVTLKKDFNPKNDSADWQHLTTFTMGLGLTSTLTDPVWAGSTYAGGYSRIVTGADTWTDSGNAGTNRIYDLWHGAINSRGQFFSTEDPQAMTLAFKSILNSIDEDVSAASGLSTSSTSIRTDSVLFQARFRPRDWSGQLLAYSIIDTDPDKGKLGDVKWDAGANMSSRNPAKIMTWVPGTNGAVFDWANLSAGQKAYLNKDILGQVDTKGADRVAWLKGDTSKEVRFDTGDHTKTFRDRLTTVLGDIVNSDLVYSRSEDFGYGSVAFSAAAAEGASYDAFVTGKSSRPAMVYAGANDGMLHGFTADRDTGGDEKFAYIPNAVYENLSALTDPGYAHQYYVDGPAVVADAYVSGNWKSVLLSGLGKGGKAVFALDISNPANFATTDVLWEKSSGDAGFGNLGYVYGKPKVVRIASGWVAIFGNGYNSGTGKASLFVLNLADGTVLKEMIADNVGPDNGLSEASLVDTNGDRIMDYAYAGDLKGNMWKFNLNALNNAPTKLFAAGATQPITSAPTWGASPDPAVGGVMLYFGTGRYLGAGDLSTIDTQSIYGIWDKGAEVLKTELQEQTITAVETNAVTKRLLRKTSDTEFDWAGADAKNGWYMDFGYVGQGDDASGERMIRKPVLSLGWLLFTTAIPKSERCDAGGDSWYFVLDPKTGRRPAITAIDIDKNGVFDAKDALSDGVTAPSAAKSEIGILSAPLVIGHDTSANWDPLTDMVGGSGEDGGGADSSSTGTTYTSGSTGNIGADTIRGAGSGGGGGTPTGVNRVFWRQIQ